MQTFDCPFCGPRDQSEFTYGREVAAIPALDAPAPEWQRYVFERDNPCGAHAEWWHHNLGCRQWLVVTRDTLTHAVLDLERAREALDSSAGSAATGAATESAATESPRTESPSR